MAESSDVASIPPSVSLGPQLFGMVIDATGASLGNVRVAAGAAAGASAIMVASKIFFI